MTLEAIVAELNRRRGSGQWEQIATASGIHYQTLTRIARGDIPNPGVLHCERIAAAMAALEPGQPAKVAA